MGRLVGSGTVFCCFFLMMGGIMGGRIGILSISGVDGGIKTTEISLSIISTNVVVDRGNDSISSSSTVSP